MTAVGVVPITVALVRREKGKFNIAVRCRFRSNQLQPFPHLDLELSLG